MKIIELLLDELEDFAGFDAVALVNQPAIEAGFHAFNSDIVHDALAFQIIKSAMIEEFDLNVTQLPTLNDYITGSAITIDDRPLYETIEEAELVAQQIGCEGHHEHVVDGKTYYMPCEKHTDITDEILENYEFESYTDYPESATNAAKRALEWRDSHPDQDCGTRVGWARANQLANRRPISEDTIARMASFARHLQHEDVPYSEGCGGLMVDAWGARAGIEWAQRKLEEIRMSSLPVDKFFDDLSIDKQEKLLERLEQVGYSKDELLNDYTITDEPQKFALPSRSSADPNGPTEQKGAYKILYEYVGPRDSKNRSFCRRLLDLNLLFRKEDIQKMSLQGANSSEFGFYSIFDYKGSFGCRHRWNKKYVYQKKSVGLLEVAALLLDQERQTKESIKNPKVVSEFSKQYKFAVDNDQQIVVGPMMIPNKLILRVDDEGEPYQVYFSEETIREIAYRMMEQKKLDEINLEHQQDDTVDGYMLESWIIEDVENDKQQVYGMNHPKGSWMGMYKIEDPEVWELVKNGTVTGFSIEAYLQNRLIQNKKVNI
jgi:hypothetical protein